MFPPASSPGPMWRPRGSSGEPTSFEALPDWPEVDPGAAQEVHVAVRAHRGCGAMDADVVASVCRIFQETERL